MQKESLLDELGHISNPEPIDLEVLSQQKLEERKEKPIRLVPPRVLTDLLPHSKSPSLGPGFQPLVSDSIEESRACGLLNPPSSAVQDWTPLNGALLDFHLKLGGRID